MPALTRSVRGSSNQLLYRVLEEPQLLAAVRELPAPVLVRLIEHVGLEDAGELIALTSTQQLGQVFDAELFQASGPGADETFRPERFAMFLRLMYEAGESFVVQRLMALPRELLTLAFHKLLLVVDIDALTVTFASAGRFDDGLDRVTAAIDNALFEEWEEFRLIARDVNAFDDVWNTVLALDREDHELMRYVIERCCDMDGELAEESGLYALLNAEDELESDIVAERSERRAAAGFVGAADARAFLELAGRETIDEAPDGRDPITRAYFRELAPEQAARSADKTLAAESRGKGAVQADVGRLLAVLKEARVMDDEPEVAPSLKRFASQGARQMGSGRAGAHAAAKATRSDASAALGGKSAGTKTKGADAHSAKASVHPTDVAASRAGAGARSAGKAGGRSLDAAAPRGGTKVKTASKRGKAGAASHAASAEPRAEHAREGADAQSGLVSEHEAGSRDASEEGKRLTLMAAAMLSLRERDPMLHAQRSEELGFLANVLVAGSRHDGRVYRPVEAIECALAVCSVGLERVHEQPSAKRQPLTAAEASGLLEQLSADRLFRAGSYALRTEIAQAARGKIAELLGVDVNDVLAAIGGGAAALVPELALNAEDAVALAALAEQEPWLAGKLAARDHIFIASETELRRARAFVAKCELSIADRESF